MKRRPQTKFVKAVRGRVCPKCGGKIGSQRVRCKRCHQEQTRPKK
jgi:ribosomal protein L40E